MDLRLPPSLQRSPPRDINDSSELFSKNHTITRWLAIIAAVFFCITLFFMFFFDFHFMAIGMFGIMFAVMSLIFYRNTKKMIPLFQNGKAAIALIRKIEYETTRSSGGGPIGFDNASITIPGKIYVEFKNEAGKIRYGILRGFIGERDKRFPVAGEEVALLYDDTNTTDLIAIFAPKFGMISGKLVAEINYFRQDNVNSSLS